MPSLPEKSMVPFTDPPEVTMSPVGAHFAIRGAKADVHYLVLDGDYARTFWPVSVAQLQPGRPARMPAKSYKARCAGVLSSTSRAQPL